MGEVNQALSRSQVVAVIELLSTHGEVLRSQTFTHWPISIGRAVSCDVVINEPHIAPVQCLLDTSKEPGGEPLLRLRALDQTNACHVQPMGQEKYESKTLQMDALHLATPALQSVDLRLGSTHMRLRTSDMALAATQLLKHRMHLMPTTLTHWGRWPVWIWALCSALLFMATVVWELWLSNNPDITNQPLALQTATTVVAVVVWAGVWATLSKIFRRQAHFVFHIFVVCTMGVLSVVLLYALHLAAFSFSWALLGRIDSMVWIAVLTALVYAHLRAVVLHAGHTLQGIVLALGILVLGITGWSKYQSTDSILSTPYLTYLHRPALRLATPMSPDTMVNRLQSMQNELDQRAAAVEPGEDSSPSGSEE